MQGLFDGAAGVKSLLCPLTREIVQIRRVGYDKRDTPTLHPPKGKRGFH